MLWKIFIAWSLMALCVGLHSVGLTLFLRWTKRHVFPQNGRVWPATWTLIRVAGGTIFLHLLEVTLWALVYEWQGAFHDLTSAFYFSSVTYTTTGYGDLVLPSEWRVVGGIEALTGILMCGLSTGMFFAVFSRVFRVNVGNERA